VQAPNGERSCTTPSLFHWSWPFLQSWSGSALLLPCEKKKAKNVFLLERRPRGGGIIMFSHELVTAVLVIYYLHILWSLHRHMREEFLQKTNKQNKLCLCKATMAIGEQKDTWRGTPSMSNSNDDLVTYWIFFAISHHFPLSWKWVPFAMKARQRTCVYHSYINWLMDITFQSPLSLGSLQWPTCMPQQVDCGGYWWMFKKSLSKYCFRWTTVLRLKDSYQCCF